MKLNKAQVVLLSSSLSVFLVGCGAPNYSQSEMHMTVEEADSQEAIAPDKIPSLVRLSPTTPLLSDTGSSDTYDVVVTSVPVRDLLFALARDSGINMDIDDRVGGLVSVSALDQTLDAILERIAKQVDIRVETVGDAIVISPDNPYFKQYHIDFLNVARTFSSSASSGGVGDVGSSSVSNTSSSDFWSGLDAGLQTILNVSYDSPSGSAALGESGDAGLLAAVESEGRINAGGDISYNLDRGTGVLIVYAPDRLQKDVQSLLDGMLSVAKRQVLLEATVVEVVLSNQYAQGIDWSLFNSLAKDGLALYQGGVAGGAVAALQYITREFSVSGDRSFSSLDEASAYVQSVRDSVFLDEFDALTSFESEVETVETDGVTTYDVTVDYEIEQLNRNATKLRSGGLAALNQTPGFFNLAYRKGDLSAAVSLLDTFGDAKVLSSPRISALNDQPALLRVVDQEVYFNIEVDETINEETGLVTGRSSSITENTVDVGFSMNVLPHVSADGEIILNLKPSVTRILDYRIAPLPSNFGVSGSASAQNQVPVTRVRELESIISLRDGEVAVLGGLLEDRTGDNNTSVPGLGDLPGIGALFQKKSESTYKTEFVVFIRARIINNPSINGDYSDYRHLLPDSDFIIRDTDETILPRDQKESR